MILLKAGRGGIKTQAVKDKNKDWKKKKNWTKQKTSQRHLKNTETFLCLFLPGQDIQC